MRSDMKVKMLKFRTFKEKEKKSPITWHRH